MADAGSSEPQEFRKALGLFDSIMIVAGIMVGSGIFIVSAEISRQVGAAAWLLVVWTVTGLLTVAGALSYGELAAMMPQAGGMYVYLREAFSPLWGFLYGWTLLTVIQTGTIAAVAIAFARFSGVAFPWIGEAHYLVAPVALLPGYALSLSTAQALAIVVIVAICAINQYGVRWGKLVQNVFTVAKLVGMVALLVLGVLAFALHPEIWRANFSHAWQPKDVVSIGGVSALTSAGMFVAVCVSQTGSLFSADSWHDITFVAGEVRNPKRNLPLALGLGTGLVIALYLLCNLCYLAVLPLSAIQTAPGGPRGHIGGRDDLARQRATGDGAADYGEHLRHRERVDAGRSACLLRDGAGRFVLPQGRRLEPVQRSGLGAHTAVRVVGGAGAAENLRCDDGPVRQSVQQPAGLCDLGGAAVLHPDRGGTVSSAPDTAGGAAAVSCVGISLASGAVYRRRRGRAGGALLVPHRDDLAGFDHYRQRGAGLFCVTRAEPVRLVSRVLSAAPRSDILSDVPGAESKRIPKVSIRAAGSHEFARNGSHLGWRRGGWGPSPAQRMTR